MTTSSIDHKERERRWRLILGGDEADGTGCGLSGDDASIDAALSALYDAPEPKGNRRGGLGKSAPNVARWLGDIRKYFPASVVQVMQKDALERLNMTSMLTEPELLETIQPDVHLVANLVALGAALPNKSRDTARMVVRKVVDELMKKLAEPTRQAVIGSLNRSQRNHRPRHNEIDWNRTIRANLKNYQLQNGHTGNAHWLGQKTIESEGHHSLRRPVWLDGDIGCLFRHLRGRARIAAGSDYEVSRVRHGSCRSHRQVARSGRCDFWNATRWRHRHQPSAWLLSVVDSPTAGHRSRFDQRSI
jgi:hypothetical protein